LLRLLKVCSSFLQTVRRHSTKGLIPKEPKQVIVNTAGVPYPSHLGEPEPGQRGRSKNKKREWKEQAQADMDIYNLFSGA